MGPAISGDDGGEGVVLLLRQGPQVPDGAEDEQGHRVRLLEGDGQGQGDLQGQGPRRLEEDARLLHGEGSQGRQDRLGHARVPPPRQARRRQQQQQPHPVGQSWRVKGRLGAVQGVQEEHRAAVVSGRRQQEVTIIGCVHGDGGRRGAVQVHGGRLRRVHAARADGRVRRQRRQHVTFSSGGGGGVHRADDATGTTRDLLLQHAGGPLPDPTNLPPPLRRRRLRRLAVPGEHGAVRRRRGRGRHGARAPAGGRRVVQQAGREGAAERRRVAGHRRHLGGEPRRDLLDAAPHGSRGLLLGLLMNSPVFSVIVKKLD